MAVRILLVEADEVLGHVLAEVLEREGYELVRARNLIEAFRQFRRNPVQAMIVDVDTVAIKQTVLGGYPWSGSSTLPALVLFSVQPQRSAVDHPLAQWCRESGQEPMWILKPFRNEVFLAVVREIVSESSQKRATDDGLGVAKGGE